jgi:hypothetical protein
MKIDSQALISPISTYALCKSTSGEGKQYEIIK